MIGQQLGPYTIEAELGSGGMGTVYRAVGPDGAVAIKIVHPHLLGRPGYFKRFLREAEVGRRVDHLNVVRTLDCDAVGGHHFLVMEVVEGRSLRELLQELGRIPETLLREIALQTAAGLAAIHEAGIVHRDLKPENILITRDHEIRIMDLGVAKLAEASLELTREGQFAGSLLYAAPEQFRGDVEVGPASDLYALGVLLHELATGDHPFRRDDHAQVIDAQLNYDPPRLEESTRFLSELTARLLAKAPDGRFESAAALHHILEEGEHATWWQELAPELDRRPRTRIRVRRETTLHGREADLELLTKAWERAKAGEGNTVWIDGEAGIGKTRLLADFLDTIADDAHVLYGSYPPAGGLGGFSDAILDHFGDVGLEERLRPYLTVTPALVPAFAALVKHDSPPGGAAPIEGDALDAVGVHLMRGLAGEKPTIWIVDDLHFAPKESRDLALALSRAAEGHAVLVLLTARPGVPEDELAHFERLENFERRNLARLGARQVLELLQDAFRSEGLAEKLGGKIALKSDGVPFFVFEMIRGLKEGQFIQEQEDGTFVQTRVVDDIEVPSAVKDLIEGRLRGLGDENREVLDVGAVQGIEFDADLVARVLGANRVQVLRRLIAIERRHGLVRDEGRSIRFDQNQIQEVLYQDVTPQIRAEYHTLLAEAFADRLEKEPAGDALVFLASHHLRGSRPREALPHLTPALDHLTASARNEAALEIATRALATNGLLEGKERCDLLLRKARVHDLRGERKPERVSLDEALALADMGTDEATCARVRLSLAQHLSHTAQYADAGQRAGEGLDLARAAGEQKLVARAISQLGSVSLRQGRYDEAESLQEESLGVARASGLREEECSVTVNLGSTLYMRGRYGEARASFQRALALARELGNREIEGAATAGLGAVSGLEGRLTEAGVEFERSLAVMRELGHRRGEGLARGNLGNVLGEQGRFGEAQPHLERSLALTRETGDRRGEAGALDNLGSLLLFQGRREEALPYLEQALSLSREIGDARTEGYALFLLALLSEWQGEAEAASRLYGETLAHRRELGDSGTIALTLVAMADFETNRGNPERAAAYLDEAWALPREVLTPGLLVLASVARARLPGGNANEALAAFDEYGERVEHHVRMEARFRLWQLTNDKTHLTEAKRLLDFTVEHSPEGYRESMLANVPLHRDIVKAWEEHGG